MKRQTYALYLCVVRTTRPRAIGLVETFSSRAKLRNWLAERRLEGDPRKFMFDPPFDLDPDAPLDFIRGTNIRKEES